MKKIFSAAFVTVLILIAASGCAPIDYRAEAVEEARKFALKEYPDLTVFQQGVIRFNEPVILIETLRETKTPFFPPAETLDERVSRFYDDDLIKPEYDLIHFAMVWDVPGLPGSFVVFGTGERSFRFRDFRSVFLKKYMQSSEPSSKDAIDFLLRTLPGLSDEDRMHVRFIPPESYPTIFPLEAEEPEEYDEKGIAWIKFLESGSPDDEKYVQTSYVWVSPKSGNRLVVTGVTGGKYAAWTPKKSMILTKSDFTSHIDSAALKKTQEKEKQIRFHERIPGGNAPGKSEKDMGPKEYWKTR